jgi:oxazoline/thiazoline synthase
VRFPRIRSDYEVEVVPPSHVVLLSELSSVILGGASYARIVPLLDGRHEASDIVDRLEPEVSAPEVYFALMQLRSAGYLVDAADAADTSRGERAFWDALGVDGVSSPRTPGVHISAIECEGGSLLAEALESAAIRVVDGGEASLHIVVVDDYLRPELGAMNEEALAARRPWLLVKPTGRELWLGPLFNGKTGGCWECLAQRLRANRQAARFIAQRDDASVAFSGHHPSHPAAARVAGGLLAVEILKWFATGAPGGLEACLVSYDLETGAIARHPFIARPQCRACGAPLPKDEMREPLPFSLESRPRPSGDLEGHATRSPEQAILAYRRHVDPITGMISSLRTDRSSPELLHGYVAVHDFSIWIPDISSLKLNLIGRSGGQGVTEAEGQLSAMGEAFERYSGVWRGEEERVVRASRAALGDSAIDLAGCLLFSERQIRERDAWNPAQTIPNHLVAKPLPDDLEIDWTPVRSLTDGGVRHLPTAYCYYGHPDMAHGICLADSNGCAGGNTLEEAILSAMIELIERDAVAIWWYNRARRPGVAIESFELPYAWQLQRFYERAGRDLLVVDVTADLGVPTFVASSARLDREPEDIMLGFGAHPDPKQALKRALREMNQFHPVISERDADGNTLYLTHNRETIRWLSTATRRTELHLTPDPGAPARTFSDFERRAGEDVRGAIERCTSTLAARGICAYVLEQTRPDVGVSVSRVVAPGLRHFWRRLAPGRLYDVPVRLGWLPAPRSEAELNPFSIFF